MGSVAEELFPKGASGGRYWRFYSESHSESGLDEKPESSRNTCKHWLELKLAEGVGFEPTVALRPRLISSQVPLTTQPPFPPVADRFPGVRLAGKRIWHGVPSAPGQNYSAAQVPVKSGLSFWA